MLGRLLVLLMLLGVSTPAGAQDDAGRIAPRPLESALQALRAGRWDSAAKIAEREGPAAQSLIEWYRLREGLGTPSEVLAFLRDHRDWPRLSRLRRDNEVVMTHAGFDDVLAFYEYGPPQTGEGALNLARALTARGQTGEAQANLVLAWRTLDLTTAEHNALMANHEEILKPHHEARMQMALWRGLRDVKLMMPLVSEDTQALAKARQRAQDGKSVDFDKLPEGGADDPGIAYERFNLAHPQGLCDSEAAIELILPAKRAVPRMAWADLPDRWGTLAAPFWPGTQMRDGEPLTAYRIAANHQLVDGRKDFRRSGMAVRLYRTDLSEFSRFGAGSFPTVPVGRWTPRFRWAAPAIGLAGRRRRLGDDEGGETGLCVWWQNIRPAFYGLLAAERAGLPPDPALAGPKPSTGDWREAAFAQSSMFKAGMLLLATGRLSQAEQFFVALTNDA